MFMLCDGSLGCDCKARKKAASEGLPTDKEIIMLFKSLSHGSRTTYNKGCRCSECRRVCREYKAKYRAKQKEKTA